jgi:hypothetical protein
LAARVGAEAPREAKDHPREAKDHPRAPREAPPNPPSLPVRRRIASPRSFTSTSTFQSTLLAPMTTTIRQASLERDRMEVASPERDGEEVASPEREVVDGEEVASPEREVESLERVEEDGEAGHESGLEMDTLTTLTKMVPSSFFLLLSSLRESRLYLC